LASTEGKVQIAHIRYLKIGNDILKAYSVKKLKFIHITIIINYRTINFNGVCSYEHVFHAWLGILVSRIINGT